MILQVLFIFACFVGDVILSNVLPHSFLPGEMVITPCIGLCALVLTQRKMDRVDSLLISVIFGIFYDYFISGMFLVCTIAFVVVNLIVGEWQKHITESIIESSLLAFTTIFIKEFVVYFIMTLLQETLMPFDMWLISRAIFTLLANAVFVVMIVWGARYIENLMLMREKRIRKEETISWWKISSKQ